MKSITYEELTMKSSAIPADTRGTNPLTHLSKTLRGNPTRLRKNDSLLARHQPKKRTPKNRYDALIEKVFFDRYSEGDTEIPFERADFDVAAKQLGVTLPKNLGDVVYSVRYRTSMPDTVLETQTQGREWLIEGAGRGRYLFRLVKVNRILPSSALAAIQIPDATPSIVSASALSDEQALLAEIRYNRIIDIFLSIT